MDAVFVLGSGISTDAGMPMTHDITEQVLSGDGAFLRSSGVFAIDGQDVNYGALRPKVEPVLALVGELHGLASDYFAREPNYEEIATIARQLDDTLSREYESRPLCH
jgi:hypothetical protein